LNKKWVKGGKIFPCAYVYCLGQNATRFAALRPLKKFFLSKAAFSPLLTKEDRLRKTEPVAEGSVTFPHPFEPQKRSGRVAPRPPFFIIKVLKAISSFGSSDEVKAD